MNIKQLKEIIRHFEDEVEVIVFHYPTKENFEARGFTVDTDMRTGKPVITICTGQEAGNLRDYESHPGFEDVNSWLYEE